MQRDSRGGSPIGGVHGVPRPRHRQRRLQPPLSRLLVNRRRDQGGRHRPPDDQLCPPSAHPARTRTGPGQISVRGTASPPRRQPCQNPPTGPRVDLDGSKRHRHTQMVVSNPVIRMSVTLSETLQLAPSREESEAIGLLHHDGGQSTRLVRYGNEMTPCRQGQHP